MMSKEAVSGMNGITMQKQEGDKKTPAGVYRFTMAFGLKANPGTILPYHQIVDGDYYVDDGNSQYYNKLANTKQVQKDWNSAEDLMAQAPQYNYGLVLDYNRSVYRERDRRSFCIARRAGIIRELPDASVFRRKI